MNKPIKREMTKEELDMVLGYQAAARSPSFMRVLRTLYVSCRGKAKEGYEKNHETAAYWSGRADALEILKDNCEDSLSRSHAQE